MSSPPLEGRMKPWPCDLEKFLHTPLNAGPEWARTVLQTKVWKFLQKAGSYLFSYRKQEIISVEHVKSQEWGRRCFYSIHAQTNQGTYAE